MGVGQVVQPVAVDEEVWHMSSEIGKKPVGSSMLHCSVKTREVIQCYVMQSIVPLYTSKPSLHDIIDARQRSH
jgi:hypothetical protein